MQNNHLAMLKRSTVLHKTTIASCVVKPCVQIVLIGVKYISCLLFSWFMANHENIFKSENFHVQVSMKGFFYGWECNNIFYSTARKPISLSLLASSALVAEIFYSVETFYSVALQVAM